MNRRHTSHIDYFVWKYILIHPTFCFLLNVTLREPFRHKYFINIFFFVKYHIIIGKIYFESLKVTEFIKHDNLKPYLNFLPAVWDHIICYIERNIMSGKLFCSHLDIYLKSILKQSTGDTYC